MLDAVAIRLLVVTQNSFRQCIHLPDPDNQHSRATTVLSGRVLQPLQLSHHGFPASACHKPASTSAESPLAQRFRV